MKKYTKYLVILAIAAVVFIFLGDRSAIRCFKRSRQISELKEQRDSYRHEIESASRQIESLHSTDSLEKYAREHYYMHAAGETIYIVE